MAFSGRAEYSAGYGYAISTDDPALTEEDVYELANRDMAFVSGNLAYIDLLTEFAHTTGGSTVALAVGDDT